MSRSYSELDADAVLQTVQALERRVAERFPDAGLRGVCSSLREVCAESTDHLAAIRRPIWPLRIASAGLLLVVVALIAVSVVNVRISDEAFLLPNFRAPDLEWW